MPHLRESAVNKLRRVQSVTVAAGAAAWLAIWIPVDTRAQGPERPALGGVWTLNQDLSDQPPGRPDGDGDRENGGDRRRDRSGGGGMGRGGRRRGGGFGGGMGAGGGVGGAARAGN